MKMLRTFTTLTSVFAVAAVPAPGVVYGDKTKAIKATSEIDEHIYTVSSATDVENVSLNVSYADLNINNEKGAAVLYRRLQIASKAVCGVRLAWNQKCMRCMKIADDCYQKALATAMDAVGSELLLSLHQGMKPTEMYAAAPR